MTKQFTHQAAESLPDSSLSPSPTKVLAQILHMRPQTVKIMLENGPHRLPPPPHRDPSDPCVVDVNYLRQIKTWVSEEKRQKFHPSLGPKYSVIEQGLSELEKRLYGYNFVDSFPTGYFAG